MLSSELLRAADGNCFCELKVALKTSSFHNFIMRWWTFSGLVLLLAVTLPSASGTYCSSNGRRISAQRIFFKSSGCAEAYLCRGYNRVQKITSINLNQCRHAQNMKCDTRVNTCVCNTGYEADKREYGILKSCKRKGQTTAQSPASASQYCTVNGKRRPAQKIFFKASGCAEAYLCKGYNRVQKITSINLNQCKHAQNMKCDNRVNTCVCNTGYEADQRVYGILKSCKRKGQTQAPASASQYCTVNGKRHTAQKIFFKASGCAEAYLCKGYNRVQKISSINLNQCKHAQNMKCDNSENTCVCNTGYEADQRVYGILKSCKRKGQTQAPASASRYCTVNGKRHIAQKIFFKASGCAEAYLCKGYNRIQKITSVNLDRCRHAQNMKCDNSENTCVCNTGYEADQRVYGILKSCKRKGQTQTQTPAPAPGGKSCTNAVGKEFTVGAIFYKYRNCAGGSMCLSNGRVTAMSSSMNYCKYNSYLQCNTGSNMCVCKTGFVPKQIRYGVIVSCKRSTGGGQPAPEETGGYCSGPGGKYKKGQVFFKRSGCNEARLCADGGTSVLSTVVPNGCPSSSHSRCDAESNECVCNPGYMPDEYYRGVIKGCVRRPADNKVCCKYPFKRSSSGGCFFVSQNKLSRYAAERQCQSMGAQLAIFNNIGSGCQRLRSLNIPLTSYWIAGLYQVGRVNLPGADSRERAQRQRCATNVNSGSTDTISACASAFKKRRTAAGCKGDKGVFVNFEKSSTGEVDFDISERQLRYVCEQSAATVDTTNYRWSDWVPSYGGVDQRFCLSRFLRTQKRRYKLCSCPVAVRCRFKDNKRSIPFSQSLVFSTYFSVPLKLEGENTGASCERRRNRNKACPRFECSVFCNAGTGSCEDANECDANSVCVDRENGHRCEPKQETTIGCLSQFTYTYQSVTQTFMGARCTSSGDPHTTTLDSCRMNAGNTRYPKIDFQGVCKYQMVACTKCDDAWWIIADNWKNNQETSKASWTKSITFKGCNVEITIDQKGDRSYPLFTVNNVEVPSNYETECVSCKCTGRKIVCTTKFGVQFSFDGYKTAEVLVDQAFANRVNGICGNFNGDPLDDFKMKDGSVPPGDNDRERENSLGQQWLMNLDDEDSEDCYAKPDVLPECNATQAAVTDAPGTCGMIKNTTIFPSLNDAQRSNCFEACRVDFCTVNKIDEICSNIESAASVAEEQDQSITVDWRSYLSINCPLPQCKENEEFGPYVCQDTCRGERMCARGSRNGCHCSPNFYLSGRSCVPASECGCTTSDGVYIPKGEPRVINCNTVYTCVAGDDEDDLPTIKTRTETRCRQDECRSNKCFCGTGRVRSGDGCVDKPIDYSCPKKWRKFNGLCILTIAKKVTWMHATRICAAYGDTATLFRVDKESDPSTLEAYLKLIIQLYGRKARVLAPNNIHFWIGGCAEKAEGRVSAADATGIPTSVDMPINDGIGPGSFDSGCMEVVYDKRTNDISFGTDDVRQALRLPICAIDPSRKIPEGCSGKLKPIRTRTGAQLTQRELCDYSRFYPTEGYKVCRTPSSIKCYWPNGVRVGTSSNRVHCSTRYGFRCRGSDCPNFRVEICCDKKSENICTLFPNACDSTERCVPLYYAHHCECAEGFRRGPDGRCVDTSSMCQCGCMGDPHCYGCGNFFFDFMGKCRYKAITNKCYWLPKIYPSLEVIAKHRVCGTDVTCAENLEIRICQTEDKDKRDDCVKAKMQVNGGNNICNTTYDSDGWESSQIKTVFDGTTCYFQGLGLRMAMRGVRWHAEVDRMHRDKMCGYCGAWSSNGSSLVDSKGIPYNFDSTKFTRKIGSRSVEFARISRLNATTFGDQWQYDDPDNPNCERTEVGEDCSVTEIQEAREKCKFIKTLQQLFGDDQADADLALENCAVDMCKSTDDILCENMAEYAERLIAEHGANNSVDWRNHPESPCPYKCDKEHEIPSRGKAVQNFCDDQDGTVTECICEGGYKFDQALSKCVLAEECSCETLMGSSKFYIKDGQTVFNTDNCGETLTCNGGTITTGVSGAAREATCDPDKLTGCRKGYTGPGSVCTEDPNECTDGWTEGNRGCIRIFEDPQDFPMAAEMCRRESGEMVNVDLAGRGAITQILNKTQTGTKVFVSGVCGKNYNRLHNGTVPGGDSYIPAEEVDCDEAENIDKCFTVELVDAQLVMKPSDCLTPESFICEKKPNEDFEWTDDCNGNRVDATSATPDVESPQIMRDNNCERCEFPRSIKCKKVDGGGYDQADGSCNVDQYFIGKPCSAGTCKDYSVQLLCPKKIDECVEKVFMCGKNEKCADTEMGYRCLCETGFTDVRENGERVCKRLERCAMTRLSKDGVLFLKPFGNEIEHNFNEQCSFMLLSSFDCGINGSPKIRMSFVNKETDIENKHLIVTVGNDTYKIFANGEMVRNVQNTGSRSFVNVIGNRQYGFALRDRKLICRIRLQETEDYFEEVDCSADEEFRNCGVCTNDYPTNGDGEADINTYFENNKLPGTAARCNPTPPDDSTTYGDTTTVQVTTTTAQVTVVPSTTEPDRPLPTETTTQQPTTTSLETSPEECQDDNCDEIWNVFRSCHTSSPGAEGEQTNFVAYCRTRRCNEDEPLCAFVEHYISLLTTRYKFGSPLGSCTRSEIQVKVKEMRDLTNCGLAPCEKPNTVRMLNPPSVQRTCANPREPEESGQDLFVKLDPECVCEDTYVIDELSPNMACVLKTDCGCYYQGQRIQYDAYVQLADDCTNTQMCKRNGEVVPTDKTCVTNAVCRYRECVCRLGFMGDGYKECKPEIEFPEKYCAVVYDSETEVNRFRCNCKMGYGGSCDQCVDIDECALRTANCGEGTRCVNEPGSYKCECLPGFERSTDKVCTDIKECAQSPCSDNARCFEATGGFYCKCCAGYSKDSNGTCLPTDPDNVPDKCCVCTLTQCYKTPQGQPDAICYTDEAGNSVTFENFRTAYVHLCLENKSFNFTGYVYGSCAKPDIVVTTPTPGGTPVQGPATNPPPPSPCGDSICTITETINDKTSGAVCLTNTQRTYPDLCYMKRSLCVGNNNSPPPLNDGDYTLGPCPQTTPPPPVTTEEFEFGEWGQWTICNVTECSQDAGIQHRERQFIPKNSDSTAVPHPEDCVQYRSCTRPGCEEPGNPTDKVPDNCGRITCTPGEYDPVCGRIGDGQDQTFDSECLMKEAACRSAGTGYTITNRAPCGSDEEEPEGSRMCSSRAIPKTVHFNTTKNGVTCQFENVQMNVCVGLCIANDGVTSSDKCCRANTFKDQPKVFVGICSDGSEHTFTKKEPLSCLCMGTGSG